jgi:hypothetical protein
VPHDVIVKENTNTKQKLRVKVGISKFPKSKNSDNNEKSFLSKLIEDELNTSNELIESSSEEMMGEKDNETTTTHSSSQPYQSIKDIDTIYEDSQEIIL